MTDQNSFLIEIGTEELPPKSLRRLADAFAKHLAEQLLAAQLIENQQQARWFAAPRRLAVQIDQLAVAQQPRMVERRGPALTAAWDEDGNPTRATLGFCRSCGVEPTALETMRTDKGEWLVYRALQEGATAAELLPAMVASSLQRLPIDRRMRWGSGDGEFVRPVHWIVALLGTEVVDIELFGVHSGRNSRGHRFHANREIELTSADAYLDSLESAHVIADYERRRQLIVDQLQQQATEAGGSVVIPAELLEEVTSLVEWPNAVVGQFDQRFLQVPAEALVASMGDHQKYFHLLDEQGELRPNFITVANIDLPVVPPGERNPVVAGNERVLRARLADAEYFWQADCKRGIEQMAAGLPGVMFQQQLGSFQQKSERLALLVGQIMQGAEADLINLRRQAALLSKADLLSDMVGEFPELQGVMGEYYAQVEGLPAAVGTAIREHYLPRFSGDQLPTSRLGAALALADRLDSLVGIFAIGSAPTGDKDPFALRRSALGAIRLLLDADLDQPLKPLIEASVEPLPPGLEITGAALVEQVESFMADRFRGYQESQGYTPDAIEAVLAVSPQTLLEGQQRLQALTQFRGEPAVESLVAANKRVANILAKSAAEVSEQVDQAVLTDEAEKNLYQQIGAASSLVGALTEKRDYLLACEQLAELREPVDRFFDAVMVMAEEPELRRNRLALLQQLRELFLKVADFSSLQG